MKGSLKISAPIFTSSKICVKIYCKEGNFIFSKKKILYALTAALITACSVWILSDTAYRNSGEKGGRGTRKPELSENNSINTPPPVSPDSADFEPAGSADTDETEGTANERADEAYILNFELKAPQHYVQLRLAVTAEDGKRNEVSEFLKNETGSRVIYEDDFEMVLASPKDSYEAVLSAVIDCPHTENVLYKNEDYYPVAEDVVNDLEDREKIPASSAEFIENIEQMCESVFIIVK